MDAIHWRIPRLMNPFWTDLSTSLSMVGLAEIGDKSQLTCMFLATRAKPWIVLSAAILSFTIVNALGVAVGSVALSFVPIAILKGLSGLLFLLFGWSRWRESTRDAAASVPETTTSSQLSFLSIFSMLFLAEFGDKTQLLVAALATQRDPIAVFVGATIALIVLASVAVGLGDNFLRSLPAQAIDRIAAVFFIGTGVYLLWTAIAALF